MSSIKCIFNIEISVPIDSARKKLWIEAIEHHQEFDYYISRFFVCQNHFMESDLLLKGTRTTLSPGAIPSVFPTR